MQTSLALSAIIRDRMDGVLERIHAAARRAGRDASAVRLVVVTKGHSAQTVRLAVEAGAVLLGENYAEEGLQKQQALDFPAGVEWHMIGHVQSRKAALVAGHYAIVHSLDSLKLARRLDRAAADLGRLLPVLLECNVSGETTKYGFPCTQDSLSWESDLADIVKLPHLEVRGLMAMAPYSDDPQAARPFFARLRRLRDRLAERFPAQSWVELSMGMSADFETAVEEGATLVRVGEAILGPRPPIQ